jgi:hypothetical protein
LLPEEDMRKANIKLSQSRSALPWLIFPFVLLFLLVPLLTQAQETPEVEADSVLEAEAVPPTPATNVIAKDIPNDKGGAITIGWETSADDGAGAGNVTGYEILRSTSTDGEYEHIGPIDSVCPCFDNRVCHLLFHKQS